MIEESEGHLAARPVGTTVISSLSSRAAETVVASRSGGPMPRQVGHFLPLEELGRGTMGIVYRAWDPKLSRVVAVKVLQGFARLDDGQAIRFRREAQTAGRLRHPHIVQVHEVGEANDIAYIVMEYVAGTTLGRVLRQGKMDPQRAARIVQQIAEGLEFAHRQGVIHRDVKPENILLDEAGNAYLGDFGLAVELGSQTRLTTSGALMGTPCYMSPEQAEGRVHDVSASTDVYGLGAVLYESLAGGPPFSGMTVQEVIHRVLQEEVVRPSFGGRPIPRDLETISLKCLEKDPSDRYPTAGALAGDLGRYLAGEPISARAPGVLVQWGRRLGRRKPLLATFAVVALALLAGACVALSSWNARRHMQAEMALRDAIGQVDRDIECLETWGRKRTEQEAGESGYAAKLKEVGDLLGRARWAAPDDTDVLVAQARYEVLQGKEEVALSLLDRLGRRGGDVPRAALFVRGWALFRRYARAKEEPAARLVHFPVRNGEAIRLQDLSPDTMEQASDARRGLEALKAYLDSGPADVLAWRVRLAFAYVQSRFDEVDALYEQALREDSGIAWDPEAHWIVARALYFEAVVKPDRTERAATLDRALAHLVPMEAQRHGSAEYWAWRGIVEHAADRHVDAIASCQRALDLDPKFLLALHNRAFAYQCMAKEKAMRGEDATSDYRQALQEYTRLLQLDPSSWDAHVARGRILSALGDAPGAAAQYEEALRLHPGDASTEMLLDGARKGIPGGQRPGEGTAPAPQ